MGGLRLVAAMGMAAGVVAGAAMGDPAPGEIAAAHAWADGAFCRIADAAGGAEAVIVVERRHKVVKNRTPWDAPLTLGGRPFDHGIYMDSAATVRVVLAGPAAAFRAQVGIDANPDTHAHPEKGSARFHVEVPGNPAVSTEVLRLADGPQSLDVALEGARTFTLRVDDGGDGIGWDQCDWGDALVIMNDGSQRFLDELPFVDAERRPAAPPFSFTYGGAHSDTFLSSWAYAATDEPAADGVTRRTVSYADPATGLRIDCQVTAYAQHPAVDWVCWLTNEGDADTPVVEGFLPLDAALLPGAADGPVTLRWSKGDDCCDDAFLPHDDALAPGETRRFAPVGGRSSNGTFPFFTLRDDAGGWVVAVGWTGQWAAEFARGDGVRVRAGMETTHFRLRPGERVRTPRILLLRWEGDDALRGHNLFRRLLIERYVPRRDGAPAAPPVAHNTAATIYQTGRPTNEANQLAMIEQAAAKGCEAFWLDAYWYPQPWHAHVGDWIPRPDDFPAGLRPLADAAHARGMKFVLWFEPERVRQGTQWDREHPEFLLTLPGHENRLFNLGDPAARAFLVDFLDGRIKDWGVDVYRQDFNFEPLPYWQGHDAPDRQGITEMRYIDGLYRFWDELVARNPALTIDNCASGGRRIDL
ncbi:MAG: alpha-galactosidase, partial [Candidatus Hydrogenedentes bacterium]|nr:alpha-galactosidase [Candidatus Hydrogenedentota bacterium]